MTKKKPKRAAKPRPLVAENGLRFASVIDTPDVGRIVVMSFCEYSAKNARRLKAWLPGAIAWCEEGSVGR